MSNISIRGNLVAPIELRFTSSGKPVGTARVAVNRGRDDKQETDFYDVVLWESLAEHAAHLDKGTSVIVVGRMVSRQFETKDGAKRTAWEVVADAFGPDLRFQSVQVTRSQPRRGGASASDGTGWGSDTTATGSGAQTGAQGWADPQPMYGDDTSTPF